MTKYVANALLATKISFINEVANLCERMEADIDDVRRGIGHDSRIGFALLCFPGPATAAAVSRRTCQPLAADGAQTRGSRPRILAAVHETNLGAEAGAGREDLGQLRREPLGPKSIAVWGLAFKPADQQRPRRAGDRILIEQLLAGGAQVAVYDPEAMRRTCGPLGDGLTSRQRRRSTRIDGRRSAWRSSPSGATFAVLTSTRWRSGWRSRRDLRRP
jgi:UDPglucose 6-dehydrogenase